LEAIPGESFLLADVNGDGEVDIADAVKLLARIPQTP